MNAVDFTALASVEVLKETIAALKARGVSAELVSTRSDALSRIKRLIPAGASVMTGASVTLREIGLEDYLKSSDHPWKNLKEEVFAEKDPARQVELRKKATLADYYLGSVHAVTRAGEVLIASATGSQLAAYAYSSPHVVWIVGAQKITRTIEDGITRIREHIMPHEEARMRELTGGRFGTQLGKLLIFHRESAIVPRSVQLIFVNEKVGD
jgi:hypothetical protein